VKMFFKNQKLNLLSNQIKICKKCRLWKFRKNAVPGEGPANARLMIIGEAPGASEDESGRPFIGKAGKFLNKLLEKNKIDRKKIFITNVVKCRPPKNRVPEDDEINICAKNYLEKQIELIKPKMILLLGNTAVKTFFASFELSEHHGKIIKTAKRLYAFTYHPSAARFTKIRKKIEKDFENIFELVK